jgi:hypothetical protein
MDFYAVLDQAVDLLRQRGRVTYRALKLQFGLDDDQLEALKDELLYAYPQAVDDAGRGLRWTGTPEAVPPPAAAPTPTQDRTPLSYTPPHLAEQILTSRAALEGERKQVTVLFADLSGAGHSAGGAGGAHRPSATRGKAPAPDRCRHWA